MNVWEALSAFAACGAISNRRRGQGVTSIPSMRTGMDGGDISLRKGTHLSVLSVKVGGEAQFHVQTLILVANAWRI
jgi:hypothetical protein